MHSHRKPSSVLVAIRIAREGWRDGCFPFCGAWYHEWPQNPWPAVRKLPFTLVAKVVISLYWVWSSSSSSNHLQVFSKISSKENTVCIYNGILLSLRKEGNPAFCDKVDEKGGHAKWNKADTEKQILQNSIVYEVFKIIKCTEAESKMVVAMGRVWGK